MFEYNWHYKNTTDFIQHHMVGVLQGSNNDNDDNNNSDTRRFYFHTDPGHQALYMTTPEQLRNWQHRKPNCQFNTTWHYPGGERRERVSSLALYDSTICNVRQLIPLNHFDLLCRGAFAQSHNIYSPFEPPKECCWIWTSWKK